MQDEGNYSDDGDGNDDFEDGNDDGTDNTNIHQDR